MYIAVPDLFLSLPTSAGWVREMYAWSVAVALHPEVKMLTEDALVSPLIVQPPHDDRWGNATMAHYTWGAM
jgi:hypothetical protein